MTKTSIKPSKSKLPDRVMSGDDLLVTYQGTTYVPHAGETVTYRGAATWAEMQRGLRLQYLAKIGPELMSKEETEEMLGMAEAIVHDLCKHIVAWTWTDGQDNPLPSPPTPEVVMELPAEELIWLFTAFTGAEE